MPHLFHQNSFNKSSDIHFIKSNEYYCDIFQNLSIIRNWKMQPLIGFFSCLCWENTVFVDVLNYLLYQLVTELLFIIYASPRLSSISPRLSFRLISGDIKNGYLQGGAQKVFFFLTSANDFNVKSELEITGSGKLSRIHAFTSSLDTDS